MKEIFKSFKIHLTKISTMSIVLFLAAGTSSINASNSITSEQSNLKAYSDTITATPAIDNWMVGLPITNYYASDFVKDITGGDGNYKVHYYNVPSVETWGNVILQVLVSDSSGEEAIIDVPLKVYGATITATPVPGYILQNTILEQPDFAKFVTDITGGNGDYTIFGIDPLPDTSVIGSQEVHIFISDSFVNWSLSNFYVPVEIVGPLEAIPKDGLVFEVGTALSGFQPIDFVGNISGGDRNYTVGWYNIPSTYSVGTVIVKVMVKDGLGQQVLVETPVDIVEKQ